MSRASDWVEFLIHDASSGLKAHLWQGYTWTGVGLAYGFVHIHPATVRTHQFHEH